MDEDRWLRIYAHLAHSRTILAFDFFDGDPAGLAWAAIRARKHLDRIITELETIKDTP
jgi:hypothetical protein